MTDYTALQRTLDFIPASTLTFQEKTVLDVLRHHTGKNNAILAGDLCCDMDLAFYPPYQKDGKIHQDGYTTDRQLRDMVKSLRKKGYPVGSGNQGYWFIVDREELTLTTRRIKSHALAELEIAAALENKTLPQILGQLTLECEVE